MKKILVVIFTLIMFGSIIGGATIVSQYKSVNESIKIKNQKIYLGYSSIIGNGNSSTLIANLENDLQIKINSTSDFVDFYIDYEMNCYGDADQGAITLTIFLNDENVSFNLVQTGLFVDSKKGVLSIENVTVERGDALTFRIDAVYGSLVPLYSNKTSATGFGVIVKSKDIHGEKSFFSNQIPISTPKHKQSKNIKDLLIERFPILYQIFQLLIDI